MEISKNLRICQLSIICTAFSQSYYCSSKFSKVLQSFLQSAPLNFMSSFSVFQSLPIFSRIFPHFPKILTEYSKIFPWVFHWFHKSLIFPSKFFRSFHFFSEFSKFSQLFQSFSLNFQLFFQIFLIYYSSIIRRICKSK